MKLNRKGTLVSIFSIIAVLVILGAGVYYVEKGDYNLGLEENCGEKRSDIYSTEVRVSSVSTTEEGLEIKIINLKSQPVTVKELGIFSNEKRIARSNESFNVGVSDSHTHVFSNFRESENCRSYNLSIRYRTEDIDGMESSGEILSNAAAVEN